MTLKEKLELIKGVKLVVKREKEFEVVFFPEQKESKKYNEDLEYNLFLCFDFLGLDYIVDERSNEGLDIRVWKKNK